MWKEYFTFSGTERRGLAFLTIIVVVLVIIRLSINFSKSYDNDEMSEVINKIDSLKLSISENRNNSGSSWINDSELFPFDPNITSDTDWKRLGLSEKQISIIKNYIDKGGCFYKREDLYKIYGISKDQADKLVPFIFISNNQVSIKNEDSELGQVEIVLHEFDPNTENDSVLRNLGFTDKNIRTINNYRKNGGKFYIKEDLNKIYGLDSLLYSKLENYIIINDTGQYRNSKKVSYEKKQRKSLIEINLADSIELLGLPGIGPVFAGRIVKYRLILGGYASTEQLLNVYGMDTERYKLIENQICADGNLVNKISLNFSSKKELMRHPYIDEKQAKAIVKYRSRNGNYVKISRILEENLIDENTYQKIFPYLSLN